MKDPYVREKLDSKGREVLRNKRDIDDYDELNQYEADIGALKFMHLPTFENMKISEKLLKEIHFYIFEPVFDWAGEYRTVPLYKEEKYIISGLSLNYNQPQEIETNIKKTIASLNSIRWSEKNLDEIALEFSKRLAKIWIVHPFRDGNTRSVLAFASIYARERGFPIDMSVFLNKLSRTPENKYSIRDLFVAAAVDEGPEPEMLANVIKRGILSQRKKDLEEAKKAKENKKNKECSQEH